MSYSHQCYLMVFHWSLSDRKSLQVSRVLLSILVNLYNPEVRRVSIRPPISKSSSFPLSKHLGTITSASIIIGITVILMFHGFLSSLARYLSLFFAFFDFQCDVIIILLLWEFCHTNASRWSFTGVWVTSAPYYYYYYLLIRVFHISVSWYSFTGDWVTASLLKSPGLFLVFWPFSIMLLFGWSPLGRQLRNPPVPLVIL